MDLRIETERFELRPLVPEDASERYVAWFEEKTAQRAILFAGQAHDLDRLRAYIAERQGREDVVFLGIFSRATGEHIGNIKYEPLDRKAGYAVMGMMIGERAWRGKGVAAEVLRATAEWLRGRWGIREIVLGVHQDNLAAIRAYEKVGFVAAATDRFPVRPGAMSMVWRLP